LQISSLCASGCGQAESTNHLFLGCAFYGSTWTHIRRWLGIYAAIVTNFYHFQHFTFVVGYMKG